MTAYLVGRKNTVHTEGSKCAQASVAAASPAGVSEMDREHALSEIENGYLLDCHECAELREAADVHPQIYTALSQLFIADEVLRQAWDREYKHRSEETRAAWIAAADAREQALGVYRICTELYS